jgi:hypothetical protein
MRVKPAPHGANLPATSDTRVYCIRQEKMPTRKRPKKGKDDEELNLMQSLAAVPSTGVKNELLMSGPYLASFLYRDG